MPGRDFSREIETALKKSEVLLAVIGKHWAGHIDSAAQSRIQQGDDYVRSEVRAALERGIPIIPILVNDADLPAREDLPEDIQGLVYKQTVRVRSDPDFSADMAMLVRNVHLLAPTRGRSTVIKLGYFLGKLDVFIRTIKDAEQRRLAEPVIQKTTWLAYHLGLAFEVERLEEGLPGPMQLSTAGLRDDVLAAFETGYHIGRFYNMALVYVATGLVQDRSVTDVLKEADDILSKAGLPRDFLTAVTRHWHTISERIEVSGPLDSKAVTDAEAEADRIIDRLAFQIAGEIGS